jgi:hypothetical protein
MKLFVYNPCARNKIANPKIHSPQNEAIDYYPADPAANTRRLRL